jgi:integrase
VVGDEEFAHFITCASPILAEVAAVLQDTGLRPDGCPRLDWSDITFTNGRHGKLRVRHGKTAAARRALPLTPRVRAVLEARWEAAGRPAEGWIWPGPTKSGHIDHSTLKKQHRRALRASSRHLLAAAFIRYANRSVCGRVDAVQDHGLVVSVSGHDLYPPVRGSGSRRLFGHGWAQFWAHQRSEGIACTP